ncbi:hypothetical protein ACVWZ8_003944 [Arthrobacter sp. UYCu723]
MMARTGFWRASLKRRFGCSSRHHREGQGGGHLVGHVFPDPSLGTNRPALRRYYGRLPGSGTGWPVSGKPRIFLAREILLIRLRAVPPRCSVSRQAADGDLLLLRLCSSYRRIHPSGARRPHRHRSPPSWRGGATRPVRRNPARCRPPRAELLTAGGEFADEVREGAAGRVSAGLRAQVGHETVCRALPVLEEVTRTWEALPVPVYPHCCARA